MAVVYGCHGYYNLTCMCLRFCCQNKTNVDFTQSTDDYPLIDGLLVSQDALESVIKREFQKLPTHWAVSVISFLHVSTAKDSFHYTCLKESDFSIGSVKCCATKKKNQVKHGSFVILTLMSFQTFLHFCLNLFLKKSLTLNELFAHEH